MSHYGLPCVTVLLGAEAGHKWDFCDAEYHFYYGNGLSCANLSEKGGVGARWRVRGANPDAAIAP
jgi:hypothetical protein